MNTFFEKLKKELFHVFFPHRCMLCGNFTPPNVDPCPHCLDNLPKTDFKNTSPYSNKTNKKQRFYFSSVAAPFYYTNQIKKGIRRIKFQSKIDGCKFFGDSIGMLIKHAPGYSNFDFITFVPSSQKRFANRGFNQAQEMAQHLCIYLGHSKMVNTLVKIKDTRPLYDMNQRERINCVSGSFAVDDPTVVKNKEILLIDDVFTTGATLNECSKILISAGASKIICACAARKQ